MAEETGKGYAIGELAKRAGVNLQTIRYYERRKLEEGAETPSKTWRMGTRT